MKYSVLIIDDEFLARKLLTEYVNKIPSLELVGTCSSAFEALMFLQQNPVDIILSDIQMPDLTGLELVKMIKPTAVVIFTTAFSEHAIESYELNAIDYLLKPIGFPRFFQAITKALERLKPKQISDVPISAILPQESTSLHTDFLMVKADHKIYRINFEELVYVEGQGEYVTFHLKSKKITAYYSLKKLEEELPSKRFTRIHKSYIVAMDVIDSIEGNLLSVMGVKLAIGKSYKEDLMNRLTPNL